MYNISQLTQSMLGTPSLGGMTVGGHLPEIRQLTSEQDDESLTNAKRDDILRRDEEDYQTEKNTSKIQLSEKKESNSDDDETDRNKQSHSVFKAMTA